MSVDLRNLRVEDLLWTYVFSSPKIPDGHVREGTPSTALAAALIMLPVLTPSLKFSGILPHQLTIIYAIVTLIMVRV